MEKLEMLPNRPENAALNSIAEKVNAIIDRIEAMNSFFVEAHNAAAAKIASLEDRHETLEHRLSEEGNNRREAVDLMATRLGAAVERIDVLSTNVGEIATQVATLENQRAPTGV